MAEPLRRGIWSFLREIFGESNVANKQFEFFGIVLSKKYGNRYCFTTVYESEQNVFDVGFEMLNE